MKKKTTFDVGGQIYVTVSAAAKLLGTTPAKVRKLMGDGTLEWSQTRLNGQIVVSRESLNRYMLARLKVSPPETTSRCSASEGSEDALATGITAEQARDIALHARGFKPTGVPDHWWAPQKVTDEPPSAWDQTGKKEPAWYVWFLPPYVGLGSSEVFVVSKRTGAVIRRESAGDEG